MRLETGTVSVTSVWSLVEKTLEGPSRRGRFARHDGKRLFSRGAPARPRGAHTRIHDDDTGRRNVI